MTIGRCGGSGHDQRLGIVMLLFQRMLRVTGGPAATAWASEVTAGVNKHAASEVSLWAGAFGAPAGTIAWSAPLEKLAQVDDLNAAMMADADLAAKVGESSKYVADVEPDRLLALVHGEITDSAPVGSYVGGVRAMAMPGKWSAAGEWAVHIAGVYSEVTGLDVVVASTVAGPMGEMHWLVRHPDASSIESSIAATMGSEKYVGEVEGGSEFFAPGAVQMYAQRIA